MPRLRPVEQPRRDGRPRAAHAPGARPPGRPSGTGGAPRRPLAAIADADLPAPARRHRRARPRPRRRARPGLAGPRRRRAGDRQVDAPAPGRGRVWPGRPAGGSVLYATGEESPGQVRLRAARLGLLDRAVGRAASGSLAEHDVGRIVEPARAERPALVDRRLDPDRDGRRARRGGRQRRPGPRVDAPPDGARQGRRDRRRPRRPRDEGRLDRRARRPSSTSSTRSSPSRASATRRSASCARRRTASARPTRSASSRWARRGLLEVADPARAFLAEHGGRRPGASSRRPSRAAGRCSSRSRRWSARRAYGTPARTASGLDPNRLACSSPSSAGGPAIGARQPRRLRQPGRRPVRRRAGARPAARPRPGLVAARPAGRAGDRGDRRGRPARRAAGGQSASSAGCARPPGSASDGRSCPRRDAGTSDRARIESASRSSAVGDPARGHRRGPAPTGRPPRGEARAGDARLTRPARSLAARGIAGAMPREIRLIRNIRVLGAALGGAHRARPGDVGRRPVHEDREYAGAFLAALGRRLDRRRLRDPAVPHGRAGQLAHPPGRGALDGRVRDRRRRPAPRPADGPPARASRCRASPSRSGTLAAARRLDLPRPRDARADRRQARGPARRGRGDRALPARRPPSASAGAARGRAAHRRRHERDHRRPDRRDRRVRASSTARWSSRGSSSTSSSTSPTARTRSAATAAGAASRS